MDLVNNIKNLADLVKKAGDIELYSKVIDLQAQALDLQEEISRLRNENNELKKANDIENSIEYHVDPYLTLKTDTNNIKYCVACWANGKKTCYFTTHG